MFTMDKCNDDDHEQWYSFQGLFSAKKIQQFKSCNAKNTLSLKNSVKIEWLLLTKEQTDNCISRVAFAIENVSGL